MNELADQKQIAGLKAGLEITAKDYLKAMRIRSLIQEAFRDLFADIDVLLAPARLDACAEDHATARSPGERTPDAEGARLDGADSRRKPGGTAGAIAAVRVRGRNADGDSIGGPAVLENVLLTIGKAFQDKTDWHKRRPNTAGANVS